jgi:hypothetical protein
MIQYLNILEADRLQLLRQTGQLTEDQYNEIPSGFNNNIIWNMGHLIATSENLLYKNTSFQRPIHEFDIIRFKRGAKPEAFVREHEILLIREALITAVGVYKKCIGPDSSFWHSPEASGVDIGFLLFHEKMHYQTIGRLMQYVG